MIYTIRQDIPGRLRLRCGGAVMNGRQANGVTKALMEIPNVREVQTRIANGSVLVLYTPGCTAARQAALDTMKSFRVLALPEADTDASLEAARENAAFARKIVTLVAFRAVRRFLLPAPVRTALILASSARIVAKGLSQLARGRLTVEVLDATAIAASLLQRQFQSASGVMFLLRLSDLMQEHVSFRTRYALEESLLIRADTVWAVDEDGNESPMRIEDVTTGQLLRVRSGASMPVDGTVMDGEGEINEASMTGESALVHKHKGSTVFAGTVVEDGDLIVRTDALPDHSRISHIVRMVEESQEAKADLQSRAERLADGIVPFSFLGFLAVLAITRNITKATSVLMVDYSCAIRISTPVAIMSAMREATDLGIVIKGGKYLEALAQADTIVFDKTGTLTEASPKVEKIITFADIEKKDVLRMAACLEEHFPHSLANAVVDEAHVRGVKHAEENHSEIDYIVAHGISGRIEGHDAILGSAHFVFDDNGVTAPKGLRAIIEREAPTASTIYMALDGVLNAAICVADPIRPHAASVISALHQMGIKKVVMLTGDSTVCAEHVAAQVGIDEFHAQVLPEDKASYVEALKKEGGRVIMVGDGINDSPALAAADVSVALNDASDIARAVADVSVQNAHLSSLITMRRISQRLMGRINRDYRFIIGFNSALIALGVAGILPPTTGAFLHNASTVAITVANTRNLLPQSVRDEAYEEE